MSDKLKLLYPDYVILTDRKQVTSDLKKYIIIISETEYEVHNKTS